MNLFFTKENIYEGSLILVNRKYPLRKETGNVLCAPFEAQQEIRLDETAGKSLCRLLVKLTDSRQITGVSGYRTREEQVKIFEDSLEENGKDFTETYVAFPGCSEHQTGLAIDLAKKAEEIDFICPDFPREGVCQEFRKQAAEYGFIERYPKEKEAVTGIGEEPWHFRYVGTPHAQIMRERGMVLEEYTEWLKQFSREKPFRWRESSIYYVRGQKETGILIPDNTEYHISGNNVDGFVVTLTGETNEKCTGK